MNEITRYLALFSIRQKLWGGFSVLLGILVLVSSNTLLNLSSTQAEIALVTHDIQPTLIASNDLRVQLKDTTSALGFYLLTKQKLHKDTYHQGLVEIDETLAQLKNAPLVQRDPAILELINAVNVDVDLFKAYEPQMLKLAENLTDNFYALGFAGSKMNPINQEVAQMVSNMIQSEKDEAASAKRRPLLLAISEFRYTWASVINNLRIYLFYANDDALSNVRLFYSGIKTLLDQIAAEKSLLTFEQDEAIGPMREKIATWGKYLEELVAIQQGDRSRMDAYLIKAEIGPILARVDERLGKLDKQLRDQTERTGQEMIDQAGQTKTIVQMLLVVGLIIGSLFAWLITRVIAQPIDSAAVAMEDIAEGEGDLTQRLEVNGRDEIAHLAIGFNHFVDKIQAVIRQVTDSVGQVSRTAEELSVATRNANQVTEQQKQESTQIATAVTQMSANAQEVARHAEMAAQAANQVDQETQAGQRIVAEALEGIRSLVNDTQTAADAVEQLGVDIEDIGSVIAMIGGITDQTNLLALNAAIEAARAGEQGRGFAVVADEVRTLAERTKQSTNEIRGRIETLQSHAHEAVGQMNRNRDVAQNTSVLAGRAGDSLQSITQAVSSINDMTHQIASSAEEQSVVAGEVNLNVCNITRLADDADAATSSVAVNCESLEQLSFTLNKLVGKFKA